MRRREEEPALYPASDLLEPDSSLIYNDWCPAMRSSLGSKNRRWPPRCCWESPWCGGERGRPHFAMRDGAPSRHPLSCGWFDGTEVTCKYHGWVFEPKRAVHGDPFVDQPGVRSTGDLRDRIPLSGEGRLCLGLRARPGRGRVRMEARDALPAVPELPKFSGRFRSAHSSPNCHAMWITASSG